MKKGDILGFWASYDLELGMSASFDVYTPEKYTVFKYQVESIMWDNEKHMNYIILRFVEERSYGSRGSSELF